jgi:hypothetical protein
MSALSLGFQRVKVIALSTLDINRANKFYGETLGLPPAYEGTEQVGYLVGQTTLMLKGLYAPPTREPTTRNHRHRKRSSDGKCFAWAWCQNFRSGAGLRRFLCRQFPGKRGKQALVLFARLNLLFPCNLAKWKTGTCEFKPGDAIWMNA